ncbi:MAG: hypothetical protein ACPGQS_01555 [Bradymonadia bacterium]
MLRLVINSSRVFDEYESMNAHSFQMFFATLYDGLPIDGVVTAKTDRNTLGVIGD